MTKPIEHHVELSFGKVTVHEDYVYIVVKEGITMIPSFSDALSAVAGTYFAGRNFVYITHRINSYSIDPTIYFKTSKIKNLKGVIVISPNEVIKDSSMIEKLFYDKPIMTCKTLDEAIEFKETLLSNI